MLEYSAVVEVSVLVCALLVVEAPVVVGAWVLVEGPIAVGALVVLKAWVEAPVVSGASVIVEAALETPAVGGASVKVAASVLAVTSVLLVTTIVLVGDSVSIGVTIVVFEKQILFWLLPTFALFTWHIWCNSWKRVDFVGVVFFLSRIHTRTQSVFYRFFTCAFPFLRSWASIQWSHIKTLSQERSRSMSRKQKSTSRAFHAHDTWFYW